MLRFLSLGSGSRGNATLIESRHSRVLLDCGFSLKELERRLALAGVDPASLDAILLTHEHSDHVKGALTVAVRYGAALWMTHGTSLALGDDGSPSRHLFHASQGEFRIGDLTISPYTVPHDAREPCQYLFRSGSVTLGVLTDSGSVTPHILQQLQQADGLILECNHDEGMLESGPYPPSLKRRVGGGQGHLSNRQAADLLSRLSASRLQQVAIAHVSEKNNQPEAARQSLLLALPAIESRLTCLQQDQVSDWLEIG